MCETHRVCPLTPVHCLWRPCVTLHCTAQQPLVRPLPMVHCGLLRCLALLAVARLLVLAAAPAPAPPYSRAGRPRAPGGPAESADARLRARAAATRSVTSDYLQTILIGIEADIDRGAAYGASAATYSDQ